MIRPSHSGDSGWVEHDAEEILTHIEECIAQVCTVGKDSPKCAGIGLDNQGETCVAFDKRTGRVLYNAIVWQDNRTADVVDTLKAEGHEAMVREKSGLELDCYFTASKLAWLLCNVPEAEKVHAAGQLGLCTLDAWCLFRLTGRYLTDVSTAARTSLMNLHTLEWDPELCEVFNVPMDTLPAIVPTTGNFGVVKSVGVPVVASVVDQTGAMFGHGCRGANGAVEEQPCCKVTFGTGAFVLANTGTAPRQLPGILSVAAWQIEGQPCVYALDGGVYNAASAVNWGKQTGMFTDYEELNSVFVDKDGISGKVSLVEDGLAFVPSLSGLACPYFDRAAAGMFLGLRLGTESKDLCRALLEGVALRTEQVVAAMGYAGHAMKEKGAHALPNAVISVDGGMANNGGFLQFFADITGSQVVVPASVDATSLGTAQLALLGAKVVSRVSELPATEIRRQYAPRVRMQAGAATTRCKFQHAVRLAQSWGQTTSAGVSERDDDTNLGSGLATVSVAWGLVAVGLLTYFLRVRKT